MSEDNRDHRRMSSSSSHEAMSSPIPTNVQVAVRCRPLNSREKAMGRGAVVQCKPNSNEVAVIKRKTYTFDRVYGQYSTQKDVFTSIVRPAVDEALAGYNCTVFAYGQTGTGKTYTMQGDLYPTSETAGIIPRSVHYIFDSLEASREEFSVRVSFLQLYNEELKDLLDPDTDKKLRLMEDTKKGGIYCMNLLEVTATTAKHVYELVNTGVKNRITSETLMNENSSRSHSIFTIRIHSKEHNATGEDLLRVGQLNLVDLAGSECVGRSGARNARAREAGTINQSLLTLGRVITALVDNLPHVPYRDSKLTRLLQESLGGRAKTTIIATVAPCADSLDESLSTLEYAFRAKNIKNKPELNQKMTKAGLLNDFGSEIETLRAALRAARLKDGVYLPLEQFTDMQERMAGQSAQLTELEEMLKARNSSCKELEEVADKYASEVAELTLAKDEVSNKLGAVENELSSTKEALQQSTQKLHQVHVVLKAFKANEKELLNNGATAATLYRASETRSAQLLKKIENAQHDAETNSALANSFRSESLLQLNAFLEKMAKHKESQDDMYHDLKNALQELQTSQATDLNNLFTTINALESLVEARRVETLQVLARDDAQKRFQREEMTGSIKNQQETMQLHLVEFVARLKSHATALMEDLALSKSKNLSSLDSVQSLLEISREEYSSFFNEQSHKLLEFQSAIDISIEKLSEELNDNKVAITAALKDNHVQQQEELSNMKTLVAQCIDRCIQNQKQKFDDQTQLIKENAKKQHKQLLSVQTMTEQKVKSCVQDMSSQNFKHESETAKVRDKLSEMRGQVEETNTRQTELVQTQERVQILWSNDAAKLGKSHVEDVTILLEKHTKSDAEELCKKQIQLTQFMDDHKDLQQHLNGGCKSSEEGIKVHIANTKEKVKSVSELGKKMIGEATDASAQQLNAMETFMKKRKMNARTETTPIKTDRLSFPAFQATQVSADQLEILEDLTISPGRITNSSQKRRKLSDVESSPRANSDVTPVMEDAPIHAKSDYPVNIELTTENSLALPSMSRRQDPLLVSDSKSCEKATVSTAKEISTTPSKLKKVGSSGQHRKNPATIHKNIKVSSSSAVVRKVVKASALAAPKRYQVKTPLAESTNSR
ncbi:putative kinesin-like protein [Plasmopara halstedii]